MTELETIISQPITLPDLSDIRNAEGEMNLAINAGLTAPNGVVIVRNVGEQKNALELLRMVRDRIKTAKDRFKVIKDPMNAAKNAVLQLEHELIDPLENFERLLSKANSDFILAERKRAQDEADALARAERDRQLEAARKESAKLEKKGKIGAAVSVMVEAEKAPVPVVAPVAFVPAKVQGMAASRPSYSAKVVDLKALAEYCLANPALLSMFLQPNEVALNTQARSLKEQFKIPGVELVTKFV